MKFYVREMWQTWEVLRLKQFPGDYKQIIPNGHTTSNSTWILRRYVEDQISTNFYVISAYFFDVISMAEKSTLFPRTFVDVISMVEICTLFLLTFFDLILMGKNSTSFLVSCKLMKTFEKVFPEFVTLNS